MAFKRVVRCNCRHKICLEIEKSNPGMGYELQQVDLLTDRTFTDGILYPRNGGRNKKRPVIHSYCPWCGKAYASGASS